MNRLLSIVVAVLYFQWINTRTTIDAYGVSSIPTMPKNRGTYRTASLLRSNAEPRSRPKRTTSGAKQSTSQDLQYLENSTTTATLDVVPDVDEYKVLVV